MQGVKGLSNALNSWTRGWDLTFLIFPLRTVLAGGGPRVPPEHHQSNPWFRAKEVEPGVAVVSVSPPPSFVGAMLGCAIWGTFHFHFGCACSPQKVRGPKSPLITYSLFALHYTVRIPCRATRVCMHKHWPDPSCRTQFGHGQTVFTGRDWVLQK